jgi:hypothetical protein
MKQNFKGLWLLASRSLVGRHVNSTSKKRACVRVCVCVCVCARARARVASNAAGSSGAAASSRHEDENANWLPHLLYGQRL